MTSDRIASDHRLRWLAVADLRIDPETQRKLRPGWVSAHGPIFDAEKIGFIVVAVGDDDGYFYVVDGQHRVALLRFVGWGDQQVQCELYEGLSRPERADLFLARNDRINVRSQDKWRIRVLAGDVVAVDIDRIVRAHDLLIDENHADGRVHSPTSLEWVYRGGSNNGGRHTPNAVARTLEIITKAWGTGEAALSAQIIKGVGLVALRYDGEVSVDDLAPKLARFPGGPPGLVARAHLERDMVARPISECVASVIVGTYNKGRKARRLPSWWT